MNRILLIILIIIVISMSTSCSNKDNKEVDFYTPEDIEINVNEIPTYEKNKIILEISWEWLKTPKEKMDKEQYEYGNHFAILPKKHDWKGIVKDYTPREDVMEGYEGVAVGHLYEFMKIEEEYRVDDYWIKSPDFIIFSIKDGVNGKLIAEYTAQEPVKEEIFEIYFVRSCLTCKSECDYWGKTVIKEIVKDEVK